MSKRPKWWPSSPYERGILLSEAFEVVLILGLAVELVFVFILDKPGLEKIETAISVTMITGGVAGAFHFGRRARISGETAQAEANARAEASRSENLRLQAFMQQRLIVLGNRGGDAEIRAARFAEVKKYAGTLAVMQSVADVEAGKLAWYIQSALTQVAGWNVVETSGVPSGRIDEGVTVITAEEALAKIDGQIDLSTSPLISTAGVAAQSLVKFLELDLGPPHGPMFSGVTYRPSFPPFDRMMTGDFIIPNGAVLILVGTKPFRFAFAEPPPQEITPMNTNTIWTIQR
jgi:hypothetical protein